MSADLRFERDGPIARITFDRPATHNAMTWEMYQALFDACETIDADDSFRVVILRGAGGRAFVAGTDIRQFLDFRTGQDGVAYEHRIQQIVDRVAAVRLPTIAVIDGYAVGGGLVLAAACDMRVVTPSARFGLPIARTLGNCISLSTCARLVDLVGRAHTMELVCTAEMVDAERAVAIGLANELVAQDRLDERVGTLTARIAAHAPLTMVAAKEAIRRSEQVVLTEADDLIRMCYGSDDFREGVAAFVEKRKPVWKGR